MGLFVSTLWLKCASTLFNESLAITIWRAPLVLKLWLNFWNLRDCFLQQILKTVKFLCNPTLPCHAITHKKQYFVGVKRDVNCNELISCDMVTKKNIQIRCLDVLAVMHNTNGPMIIPMVAHRIKICNIFAVAYA